MRSSSIALSLPKSALAALAFSAAILPGCGRPIDGGEAVPAPQAQTDDSRVAAATDQAFLTLDGSVVSVRPDSFMLDYGQGRLNIEMDDWDWLQEGRALKAGDRVTVSGRFDQDLYEAAKLEASSVYVENLGSVFYASSADEEDLSAVQRVVVAPRNVDVTGRVSNVDGRVLTIADDKGSIKIDTSGMSPNPLDAAGTMKVEAGDRIYAWGDLRLDGLNSVLKAQGIIDLAQGPQKDVSMGAQAKAAS